ncbi:MAG: hypothetical protein JXB50_16720 [Spirochaetes bacterium]|nr:hypothetical protein [Spirochaetota bacterium]
MKTIAEIYEDTLYKFIKEVTNINIQICTKKITSLLDIKKRYLALKNYYDSILPTIQSKAADPQNFKSLDDLKLELEKSFSISLQLFKSFAWGDFHRLNPRYFPELYEMMTDQHGDLKRSFDEFSGTVAMMDFHGYTQFSKDIKYNKTPLQEFGDILPQKIEEICTKCKTIIYEMEGDALILIGPENPIFIFNAILCIIELCRQKPFKPKSNPKSFHGIDIVNPILKPFEMNVAITTGGRVFINKNGHIIGTLISEASRILRIINTKKPNKSGILISDKVYRRMERFKNTQTLCHVSIFDFKMSDTFIVDVKGTRLNIREIYLEEKKYIEDTLEFSKKLVDEIRKRTPTKWNNILSFYLNLVIACLNDIKCIVNIGKDSLNQDKTKKLLELKFYEWITNPTLSTILDILNITSNLYTQVEEIRDVTAIYHEFVQENYSILAKQLEEFYDDCLFKETDTSPNTRKIVREYENELNNVKKKFPVKRIMSSILSNEQVFKQLLDIPYMGKK